MNRLKSLSLSGFRSIRQLEDFELKPLNVLIGANGAGKSNLIAFFRMLKHLVSGELQLWVARQGGASSLLHDGPAITPELTGHLAFETEDQCVWEFAFRLTHTAGDNLVFADERYRVSTPDAQTEVPFVELGIGHRESNLDSGLADGLHFLMRYWQVYQFHNTTETARIRQRSWIHDSNDLKEDGGNLAAVLYRLKRQPRYFQRIVATLRQIVPCFADFHLEPDDGTILLRWKERGSDNLFGPHQASDGTLRLMALTTLLLQPFEGIPFVLLLDEPELGLHPAAINVVGGLIRNASRHVQVIVATQSIPLLDQFTVSDVVTVNRKERESIFARPDAERLHEWLEAYSLGELWEKNVLAAGLYP